MSFQIFGSKTRALAGLDISSSSVKVVELTGGEKEGYRIERFSIEPLPKDAVVDGNIANLDAVGDGVRRAMRRLGGSIKQVAVALPASAVITKRIILPDNLREQDMEIQVESEANQYIPFALDEVNLDFQVIGPSPASPDDVEVLIAASRKEKVEDRVAAVESAGLKAAVVDVDSFASEAAFTLVREQLPGKAKDRIVALVDIGANSTHVTILRDNRTLYSREQPIGGAQLTNDIARQYQMEFEEAETAKLSGDLPEEAERDLIKPFLDNVALEVSRALQFFFTSTQFNEVHYIVLAGGCATLPGLDTVVSGRTQVETVIANPFAQMSLSSKVRSKSLLSVAPSLMVACGLALRRFDS